MTIRLLVKEVAESKGLNAPQVARKANLANDTVYALFNEPYKAVSTKTLEAIATALDVRVTDLFIEEE